LLSGTQVSPVSGVEKVRYELGDQKSATRNAKKKKRKKGVAAYEGKDVR